MLSFFFLSCSGSRNSFLENMVFRFSLGLKRKMKSEYRIMCIQRETTDKDKEKRKMNGKDRERLSE